MNGFDILKKNEVHAQLMNTLHALIVTVVVEMVIVRMISDQAPVLVLWLIAEMVY